MNITPAKPQLFVLFLVLFSFTACDTKKEESSPSAPWGVKKPVIYGANGKRRGYIPTFHKDGKLVANTESKILTSDTLVFIDKVPKGKMNIQTRCIDNSKSFERSIDMNYRQKIKILEILDPNIYTSQGGQLSYATCTINFKITNSTGSTHIFKMNQVELHTDENHLTTVANIGGNALVRDLDGYEWISLAEKRDLFLVSPTMTPHNVMLVCKGLNAKILLNLSSQVFSFNSFNLSEYLDDEDLMSIVREPIRKCRFTSFYRNDVSMKSLSPVYKVVFPKPQIVTRFALNSSTHHYVIGERVANKFATIDIENTESKEKKFFLENPKKLFVTAFPVFENKTTNTVVPYVVPQKGRLNFSLTLNREDGLAAHNASKPKSSIVYDRRNMRWFVNLQPGRTLKIHIRLFQAPFCQKPSIVQKGIRFVVHKQAFPMLYLVKDQAQGTSETNILNQFRLSEQKRVEVYPKTLNGSFNLKSVDISTSKIYRSSLCD